MREMRAASCGVPFSDVKYALLWCFALILGWLAIGHACVCVRVLTFSLLSQDPLCRRCASLPPASPSPLRSCCAGAAGIEEGFGLLFLFGLPASLAAALFPLFARHL